MEKKITAEDVKRELIARLKGEEAKDARWKSVNVLREMVKPILAERGCEDWAIMLDSQNSDRYWNVRVSLNRYGICIINIKRKRGAYHHGYFGCSYYDWSAEDFDVYFFGSDAEDAIAKAIDAEKAQNDKNAIRKARAKEIAKLVMDRYNVGAYEAAQILSVARNEAYCI